LRAAKVTERSCKNTNNSQFNITSVLYHFQYIARHLSKTAKFSYSFLTQHAFSACGGHNIIRIQQDFWHKKLYVMGITSILLLDDAFSCGFNTIHVSDRQRDKSCQHIQCCTCMCCTAIKLTAKSSVRRWRRTASLEASAATDRWLAQSNTLRSSPAVIGDADSINMTPISAICTSSPQQMITFQNNKYQWSFFNCGLYSIIPFIKLQDTVPSKGLRERIRWQSWYYSKTGCNGMGMCAKRRQWLGEEMYGVWSRGC